jgi:anti-anti-sigma factor
MSTDKTMTPGKTTGGEAMSAEAKSTETKSAGASTAIAGNNTVTCALNGTSLVVTILAEQLRDIATVQSFRDGVLSALEKSTIRNVIIDLSSVKHIGSVAFLAFLAVRRQSGVDRIVLCNVSEFVQELFRMCKLIATGNGKAAPFEQTTTLEEALALCKQ